MEENVKKRKYLKEVARCGSQYLKNSIIAGILTEIQEFLAKFLQQEIGWHLYSFISFNEILFDKSRR